MVEKGGQVTVFIIIGLVLVLAFGLIIYIANELKTSQIEAEDSRSFSAEINSIRIFTQSCITQTLRDSISRVGITNSTLLENYFNIHLKDCTKGFNISPGISLSEGIVSSDLFLDDSNKKIIGDINFPLNIHKGDSVSSISKFSISYDLISQIHFQLQNNITTSKISIASQDGITKLIIPENTKIIQKNGEPVSNISVLIKEISQPNNKIFSLEYDFQPDGLLFDPPVTLEFNFNDENNDSIVDETIIKEEDLVISYKAYPYLYVNLLTTIDKTNNKITAQISHFSTYTVSNRSLEGVGIANVYLIDPITNPQTSLVELSDLDGSGYLKSKYVDITNVKYIYEPPTPRVKKTNLNFTYQPIEFGQTNYWGYDDVSDEGHRFDQTSVYFYTNNAAKYFDDKFGFQAKGPVLVGLYDIYAGIGGYLNYKITGTMPEIGEANAHRQVRGSVHEYTHLVQGDLSYLPYITEDGQGLVESFAKYFECAFTNTSYDPYIYNPATGIKNFSDYDRWKYERNIGKGIGFVIASTWWHLREELGEEIVDDLVYESMKHVVYNFCAGPDALEATIKADEKLNSGENYQIINDIFNQHNIYIDKCFVITY